MFNRLKSAFTSRQEVKLSLKEARKRLGTEFDEEREDAEQSVGSLVRKTHSEFQELNQTLDELRSKDAGDKYINSLKDNLCERSMINIGRLRINKGCHAARDYAVLAKDILNQISNISSKEAKHLHKFKDGMESVASKIKDLYGRADDIANKAEKHRLFDVEEAERIIDSIHKLETRIMQLGKEIRDMEKTLPYLKEKTEEAEKGLGKAKNREGDIDNLNEPIKQAEKDIASKKQDIANLFGFETLIKKFLHDSDVGKEDRQLLEKYTKSPVAALRNDKEMRIKSLLKDTDVPGAGEKDVEKLRLFLNSDARQLADELESLQKALSEKKKEFEETKKPAILERRSCQKKLEESRRELESLKVKRNMRMLEKERLERELENSFQVLEKKLSELFSQDVTLARPDGDAENSQGLSESSPEPPEK